MLRKLKLYGELAEFVGHKEFEIQVDSLGKAVSFLVNNFPQVEKYMNPQYYQVKVGNYIVNEQEIHYPIGQEDIHIVPVIAGAGGSTGKLLLGGALLALSFGAGGFINMNVAFGKGFFASFKTASFAAKAAFGVGSALVLSGVTDMLFPLPKFLSLNLNKIHNYHLVFWNAKSSRAGLPFQCLWRDSHRISRNQWCY